MEEDVEKQDKGDERGSSVGSSDHLVQVKGRKFRCPGKLLEGRTKLEKRLFVIAILFALLCLALIIAVSILALTYRREKPIPICYSPQCVKSAGMLLENMDPTVNPCDDFYKFTCGRWSDEHPTQEETNSWFQERTRHQYNRIADVLTEGVMDEDPEGLVKAKLLFESCLDLEKLDSLGMEPMIRALTFLELGPSLPGGFEAGESGQGPDPRLQDFSLARTLALAQRLLSMDILVQLSLTYDNARNTTIVQVSPSLGRSSLPELGSEKRLSSAVSTQQFVEITMAYMTGVFAELDHTANVTDLAPIALKILLFESQTANDMQRNMADSNVIMTFQELQDLMQSNTTGVSSVKMDWSEYLRVLMSDLNRTVSLQDRVEVVSPGYFQSLGTRLHSVNSVTLERYIWWAVVAALAPHTTSQMRILKEEYNEALYTRSRSPRLNKCVKYVKTFMNMAISSKFANDGKVQETSKKVDRMLKDIISSFNGLVSSSPWMDERTKLLAKRKASAIKSFIGYPEYLLHPDQLDSQYQSVDILKGQFLWSLINIKAAEVKNILRRIGDTKYETNDNKSWMSDPLDVNAFYGRSQNAIAVPAGILQNPFYNLGLESLNYGAIGSILGHELTHAFDNEGKNYDEKGEKHSWWSKSMMKEYDIRAKCFVRQYNNYSIDKNFKYKINGTQTLGENIADNGGVREALQAYKLFEERNGVEPKLPGLESFSHEQLFFLAYANVWCEKTSLDNDVSSLQDVHTPNRFRVKGALSNSQAFSKAWFCPSGTPMNPRSKCTLW